MSSAKDQFDSGQVTRGHNPTRLKELNQIRKMGLTDLGSAICEKERILTSVIRQKLLYTFRKHAYSNI